MNNIELALLLLVVIICLACVGYCLFTVRLNYKLYTEYFKTLREILVILQRKVEA